MKIIYEYNATNYKHNVLCSMEMDVHFNIFILFYFMNIENNSSKNKKQNLNKSF